MRIFKIAFVTLAACALGQLCSAQGIISTVAGNGSLGDSGDGGPATSASLGNPTGVVVDKAGNIYIADSIFNVIRKVNTKGIISTFAGGIAASLGDGGPATSARLVLPAPHIGLAVDSSGNVYIADPGDMRVRKVDTSGKITTVAGNSTTLGLGSFSGDGGAATSAGLNSPYGVALDSKGNMYIADSGNQRIRKVDTSGKISTIAGVGFVTGSDTGDGGPATKAELHAPTDVAVDSAGNVYIADSEQVRQINTSGIINSVAHGFFGTCNQTPTPASGSDVAANGLAVDGAGNLYMADKTGGCIQELETDGLISSIAGGGGNLNGDGGPATSAALTPSAVALDSSGNLYITSVYNVRKVTESGVQPSQKPIISTTNGVVNGASFTVGIAPNTFVTINGTNFSTVTDTWTVTGGVLPTSLDGVSVSFGGLPGYVNYVSPTQINVLTPANLTGEFTNVIVTNSAGASVPSLVVNSEYMPAFFTWPGNQVVATHSDFTFAVKNGTFPGTTTVPAKPGETIILWGTGFGPTMPATPEGTIVPSNQTYSTTVLPTLQLSLVYAKVYGVALAPGFAGLYQLAFQVPSSLSDGDYQLFANAGAPEADVPMLTVQQ
jgi:uncharacterized protein (TIGR03437 family)